LRDGVHRYHLETAEGNKHLNGPITCLDCHAAAMRGREQVFLDTIFINAFDLEKSSYDLPTSASIRQLPILRIDTLRQNRPLPLPHADSSLALAEWMTGLAHLNGRVDVAMDARNGAAARFDIKAQTCSAVACHRNADGDVYPLVPDGGAKRGAGGG
jgi:predicted CxxxxCH...CXXCH cytochrome family protein